LGGLKGEEEGREGYIIWMGNEALSLSLIFGERKNNGAGVDGKNEGGNEWAMCVGFWIFSYR
jgi:hypothetical protein